MSNTTKKEFIQEEGHGFDPKIVVESKSPEDYVFGDGQLEEKFGAAKEVIKADGQWDKDLPKLEIQRFNWGDTYHCTVFGTENPIQTLMKAKYGQVDEYSERFLGVLAGITQSGGSPNTVAEAWRKNGNLPYEFLPFENINSWAQFNSPKPMTNDLLQKGLEWIKNWEFGHDWVYPGIAGNIKDAMKDALKYSPLGVGLYAWKFDSSRGVYYKPSGATDNHWVMCYGYVEGKYWKVYDHYDNELKKVDWDYPFQFVKRYTLGKRNQTQEDKGYDLFTRLRNKHIMRSNANGEVYHIKEQEIVYEPWWTNSPYFQKAIDEFLRKEKEAGRFTGISEQDFADLTSYIKLAGIPLKDDGLQAIQKLNKLNQ